VIGGMGGDTYAAPKALRHATSMVLRFKKSDKALTHKVDGEDIPVGQPYAVRVERSKVGPGGRTAQITIRNVATEKYGPVGFDFQDEAITVGMKPSVGAIIQGGGGYYTLPNGERIRGEEKMREYLAAHPEVITQVREIALASVRGDITPEKPELEFIPAVDQAVEESA
jgi:hypothetical protein